MSEWVQLVAGPTGALVLALAALIALTRYRMVVPVYYYDRLSERTEMLEAENRELNKAYLDQTRQLGHMESELSGLRTEVASLRSEILRLRGD